MEQIIQEFVELIKSGRVEIYNEFSLQHELGIFLRNKLAPKKIQFERNVSHFGLSKLEFQKKEIDISIFDTDKQNCEAIELKFPKSQFPEQMFSCCKDIKFLEQLVVAGFQKAYLLIIVEDKKFYSGASCGIYAHFRRQKPILGTITKPTGQRDLSIDIVGNYVVDWCEIVGEMKYALIEIGPNFSN